jgi:hypothetical protein
LYDALYTAFSISFEYLIPLICILYWNTALMLKIRRKTCRISDCLVEKFRMKSINVEPIEQEQEAGDVRNSISEVNGSCSMMEFASNQAGKTMDKTSTSSQPEQDGISLFSCTSVGRKLSLEMQKEEMKQTTDALAHDIPKPTPRTAPSGSDITISKQRTTKKSIKRASVILIFITLEIIVLRTPYVVARVVSLICGICMSWVAYTSLYWLGWGMSIINPFLYAFISGAFKQYCSRLWSPFVHCFYNAPKCCCLFTTAKCCRQAKCTVSPVTQ